MPHVAHALIHVVLRLGEVVVAGVVRVIDRIIMNVHFTLQFMGDFS